MHHVLHQDVDSPQKGALLRVSSRLRSIGSWGLGKRVSCAKNGWTDLHDLYVI